MYHDYSSTPFQNGIQTIGTAKQFSFTTRTENESSCGQDSPGPGWLAHYTCVGDTLLLTLYKELCPVLWGCVAAGLQESEPGVVAVPRTETEKMARQGSSEAEETCLLHADLL